MTEFPTPGPRRRAPLADNADEGAPSSPYRGTSKRAAETESPRDEPVSLAATFDVVKASKGENPWGTLPELSAEPRKFRQHANAVHEKDERKFDKTALHFDLHGRLMSHADYIAHCEKYDYAWRSIQTGDRILDVGCGTDAPLMKAINFVQSQAAKVLDRAGGCYVGVDLNPLKETRIAWAKLIGELDITSDEGYEAALYAIPGNWDAEAEAPASELRGYTLIVCLEVIEHMGVEDGRRMLMNMRDLLGDGGRIILSTPVYDGKGQARNHIHEYYIDELRELIESCGLAVTKRMGTFTAEPQLKAWLKKNRPDWLALYLEAREFHSSGYMSGVIAPMVPDIARNNVWVLERREDAAS